MRLKSIDIRMKPIHLRYLSKMLAVVLVIVITSGTAIAQEVLRVNTSIKPPFSTKEESGFFDVLLKELGKRLDFDIDLIRLPPERALFSVNEGLSDAELPRIAGIESKYPNLVMVDEKVIDYNFVAFTRGGGDIAKWADLPEQSVGYLIGWKIFEKNVPVNAVVCKQTKPSLLFRMLYEGRIDVALYERYAGWNIIKAHSYFGFHECTPPLAVKPMYMYLNKRHADLAPKIAEALREMKKDGTYKLIMAQTLEK